MSSATLAWASFITLALQHAAGHGMSVLLNDLKQGKEQGYMPPQRKEADGADFPTRSHHSRVCRITSTSVRSTARRGSAKTWMSTSRCRRSSESQPLYPVT